MLPADHDITKKAFSHLEAKVNPEAPKPETVSEEKVDQVADEVISVENTTPSESVTQVKPEATTEAEQISFDDWDAEEAPSAQTAVPSQEAEDLYNDIPDNWKTAISLLKEGKDALSYLGITKKDYSKEDPLELYRADVWLEVKEQYGELSQDQQLEKYKEFLDTVPEFEQRRAGKLIRDRLVYEQQLNSQRELQRQSEAKAQADKEIKQYIDSVKDINNMPLKPHQKQITYDYITSGGAVKDLQDRKTLVEFALWKKYGKKSADFLYNNLQKQTRKDLFKEVAAPSKEAPSAVPRLDKVVEKSNYETFLNFIKPKP